MSIVQHKPPAVDSPRSRSDLRAVAGLIPAPLVARPGRSAGAIVEQLRVARLDGAVIGACRITPEVMRLGESRLKMGVVRNVAVHPQFNPVTVRAALLEDARRHLQAHRYHVALITGTEFELRRFGFTPVFHEYAVRLGADPETAIRWDTLRVRPAKHGDIAAMSRLYSAAYDGLPGSVIRTRAHMAQIWFEYEASCVVTDSAGKVLAYFVPRVSGDKLVIVEFAWTDPVTPAVLKELLREFADVAESTAVVVTGPRTLLEPLDIHTHLRAAHEIPTGFVACADIDELFESMEPEWERLLEAEHRNDDLDLTILVDNAPYRIRSHRGSVMVDNEIGPNKLALTPSELTHALLGSAPPEDLLGRELRLLNTAAADFFKTLFPLREPAISPIDLL